MVSRDDLFSVSPQSDSTGADSPVNQQTVIEEYGKTFMSLIDNVLPTQSFWANGVNVVITPLNQGTIICMYLYL